MTDLVTGAGGFAGRVLVQRLLAEGRRVVGWMRRPDPWFKSLDGELVADAFDLCERGAIERRLEELAPERVYHLAAVASPRAADADPARARAVNVEATRRLLEHIPREVRCIVVSTAAVYAGKDGPIAETDRLAPRGAYATSKLEAEEIAGRAAARGANVVVVRPFNHSGKGQTAEYALPSFARRLARFASEGGELRVGELDLVRDYMHVEDTVRAYIAAAEYGEPGETYNVCSGRAVTMRALLEGLARLIAPGALQRVVADPKLASGNQPSSLVGSTLKLETLPFAPELGLGELLGDVAGV